MQQHRIEGFNVGRDFPVVAHPQLSTEERQQLRASLRRDPASAPQIRFRADPAELQRLEA